MPYQPRIQPIPQIENPLRSLSDWMGMARNLRYAEEEDKRFADEDRGGPVAARRGIGPGRDVLEDLRRDARPVDREVLPERDPRDLDER